MTSSVRDQSAAVSSMSQHWPMIRALQGGTSAMRVAGEAYLPKWPNEEQKSYDARLKVATLYPAFSRTVEVLAAKPFSKPLTLSDMPQTLEAWCDDIDLQGRNLHSFAADVFKDCVGLGMAGVLVDFPPVEGVKNREDEKRVGARPYFVHIKPENILGFKISRVNGSWRLIQLRLLEVIAEEDGEFGEKDVEQVRVYAPGKWAIYRKVKNNLAKDEWALYQEGTTTIQEIPFVFVYGDRVRFGVSKPPLLELAHQNVEHWQSRSDQQTILHVARVPILTVIGAENAAITVGASSAVALPLSLIHI